MRKKALWIIGIAAGFAVAIVSAGTIAGLRFHISYLEDRIDAQKMEAQKDREVLLLKLEEALAPEPEILHATLTFEQVQQAAADGAVACFGAYPLAGIDYSGGVMQFALAVGGSYNVTLLEKGKDVFPTMIQMDAPYTICRDVSNGKRVVWVHPSSFNGVKPIKNLQE
ncbi:MAG: hypothetical protein A3A27_02505 [Candidatus Wildermuthbacteria bacterium RIFCSPLOWO2_01_FULL_47_18]|uniref:Uncharacterized protein n=1 Tax=Candidatus Wildermuthbacteria bacterium RIFCSPLOWO2_01_FULL_47_18 TaxID=1802460 RepID=A0A1G2RGX3_9BACT|nr:MAG: hypothetical protein A3A27_02505 [Candidatus Wildermuthbacteria bacterium RIFCSPLOWO2_01_FULL_47_18]